MQKEDEDIISVSCLIRPLDVPFRQFLTSYCKSFSKVQHFMANKEFLSHDIIANREKSLKSLVFLDDLPSRKWLDQEQFWSQYSSWHCQTANLTLTYFQV